MSEMIQNIICPRVPAVGQNSVQNTVAKRYAGLCCNDIEGRIKSLSITSFDYSN